ncbi:hypothetical protein [Epilithonimonas xixisoli]|uniref:Uncharacterized protein n=1 Tax=Epilithonimonas xixisoli TaxID=1476462 RepID=A0A4R8IBR4_9FLAO|nr:hypothetical protein [Epilithonimonas xixisoli]TDX87154.1 hypothetical protein B0I22_1335 [Epilithonimonas xixisoli]
MRKLVTNLVVVSALFAAGSFTNSCSKVEDIIDDISVPVPFSIPVTTEVEIPYVLSTEFLRTPEIPLNLDLDAKIKEKFPSLSINNLKSAKLEKFSIDYVSSTGGAKLDKVKNAKLILKAPNLPEQVVAVVNNNTNADILNFTPNSEVELLEYLKSNQASFILEVQGSEAVLDQMKMKINSSFKIEVGL